MMAEVMNKNCWLQNSLKVAVANDVKTIAFPNISTGIYRFPKRKAAEIAVGTVKEFLGNGQIDRVVFVCFDGENYEIYRELVG